MIASALDFLACPSCGGTISPAGRLEEQDGEILYGVVRCRCAEHPIVAGILSLGTASGTPEVVDRVARGDHAGAVAMSLSEGLQRALGRARWLASQGMWGRVLGRLVVAWAFHEADGERRRLTMDAPLCRVLGASDFETYLKHRFSAESFWPLLAALPVLRQRSGTVVDIGCGIGHASFVISTMLRPRTLFSLDRTFWELFLARRYMSSVSNCIAVDVNGPLPLRDASVDCVIGLDMFHYVDSRAALARETVRVMSPDGLLAMLHVHNATQPNLAAGRPLPPSAWLQLFPHIPVKAFSEPRLIEDFMTNDRFDVSQSHAAPELEAANAIELFASRDERLFRAYEDIRYGRLDGAVRLRINPIYRRVANGRSIVLERAFPSERFRQEYPLSEKYLPRRVVVDGIQSEDDLPKLAAEHPETLRDFVRRFVVLPLPERYL